jgi:hypothetical protein
MRPVLGDRKSLAADFAITIDEPNLAAMKIFVDELRSGHVRRLADVSSESLARLKAHYAAMVQKNPKDPAAAHYLNLLLRATQAKRPAAGEMR